MKVWSPSKLAAHESCGKRGRLYEERAPQPDSEPREVGAIVHMLLFARSMGKPAPDLSQFRAEYIAQAMTIADSVAVRENLEGACEQHFEHGVAVDANWKPVEFNSPAAMLRGVFDVVSVDEEPIDEGEYFGMVCEVQDYKSGWAPPRAEGIQGMAYALIAAAHWPQVEAIRVKFHQVRMKKFDEFQITLPDESGTLERYRQIVTDKIARAEKSDGKATVGGACVTCSYRGQCEEFKASATAKMNPADPYAMAKQYLTATAHLDDIDARLRASVEVMGNLHVDGYEIGFLPSENSTVDFAKLCGDWVAQGGELKTLLALLKPGKTVVRPAISALAKQRKAKVYEVEAEYVSTTEGRRWGSRKGKD